MSGGSYDYAYHKVNDFADQLRRSDHYKTNPRRMAFAILLYKVSEAMKSIEWVDSCDYGPGDEDADINACFQMNSSGLLADAAISELEAAIKMAEGVLKEIKDSKQIN
jgi:hypothetical protein